jgi:hypothetical protein
MSGYTIGEIVVWLVLAAILGFVLGWLVRGIRAEKVTVTEAAPVAAPVALVEPGRFPGSAKPLPGGDAPSPDYTIKGNEKSMIYHTPQSRSYARTIAQTWFSTEHDAVAAGFRKPRNT